MSSIFETAAYTENKPSERTPLAIGKYGNGFKGEPGLKIVKYLGDREHPFLAETTTHTYVVAPTDKDANGTALLTIEVRPYTLTNEAVAVSLEVEDKAIADGLVTAEGVELFKESLRAEALASVKDRNVRNGVEAEPTEEDIEGKYKNLRINLAQNVGNILALQAWADHTPGIDGVDFAGFNGVQFAGSVDANRRGDGTEVKRVFKRGRK